MGNDKDINAIIEELKKSPIHSMSLGSKELFHSNFWAWIMNNVEGKDDFIKFFFRDINLETTRSIGREKNHMDITITGETGVYVIENKIKSYPYLSQIEEYTSKLKEGFKAGVLTGIMEPDFDLPAGWRFVSYKEIAGAIQSITKKNVGFSKEILREYADYVVHLDEIVNEYNTYLKGGLPIWCDYSPDLDKLRLWDICQKYAASRFLQKCLEDERIKRIKDDIERSPRKYKFYTGHSFNTGYYTLDFRIQLGEGNMHRGEMGVQIQGPEYRLFAERVSRDSNDKGSADAHCDQLFKDMCKIKWFRGDYTRSEKLTYEHEGLKGTSQNKPYGKYTGRSGEVTNKYYSFIYQYYNIDDKTSSFEFMIDRIADDLRVALSKMDTCDCF